MKRPFHRRLPLAATVAGLLLSPIGQAADYLIDTKASHAFIQFRIQHLGYSWLYGRFNSFDGRFSWDEKQPTTSKVEVNIDPASIDSNHVERDNHLRSKDFLDVKQFPTAHFVSTSVAAEAGGGLLLKGKLSLHGVTRDIDIKMHKLGEGADPWGGYRAGFAGTTTLRLKDYGIQRDLGPASQEVELTLSIEGVRQ